jgi:hypothetical protein
MLEKNIIDVGYKRLAAKYHPDNKKTGNEATFKALTAARGNLVALLASFQDGKEGAFRQAEPTPRVVYPSSNWTHAGPPPIVPGSRHTVDDVIDLAGKIVDIFGGKPRRRRTAGNRKSPIGNHK